MYSKHGKRYSCSPSLLGRGVSLQGVYTPISLVGLGPYMVEFWYLLDKADRCLLKTSYPGPTLRPLEPSHLHMSCEPWGSSLKAKSERQKYSTPLLSGTEFWPLHLGRFPGSAEAEMHNEQRVLPSTVAAISLHDGDGDCCEVCYA